MSWFVLVFFVISVSYHPKSEPSKRNGLAETIETLLSNSTRFLIS